jgi:membrane protease subunit (stomatin/prohibitin family)
MWTCPKCERELKNANQWHNCVKVSIDSLFEGKAAELVFVFDKLLSEIINWENVAVSATQNCIVFVHNQTFLIIRPMKKELDVKFYSTTQLEEEPIIKSIFYSGKYQNHIRVSKLEDLTQTVYTYIKQSYQLL